MPWELLRRSCRPISQRFIVATMVLLGIFVQYTNRWSFEIGLFFITHHEFKTHKRFEDACPNNSTFLLRTSIQPEFEWTTDDQMFLLIIFLTSYTIAQLPGGLLSDLYGPKRVMGVGIFISGICAILTPVCARATEAVWLIMVNRFILGLAQGPMFPSVSSFIARWYSPTERNIMSAYIFIGIYAALIYSKESTLFLFHSMISWDPVFYVHGTLTVAFLAVWLLFTHDNPTKHPCITDEERDKINFALRGEKTVCRYSIPLADIFKSLPVWALIIAHVGYYSNFHILFTLLPLFERYHFSIVHVENLFNFNAAYVILTALSILSAFLGEFILKKKWLSRTKQCKVWTAIANIVPGILILLIAFGGCNRNFASYLYILAFGFWGFGGASVNVINVHMTPNFAGLLMGLMNGFGSLMGAVGFQVVSFCMTQETLMCWRYLFLLNFVFGCLTTIFFIHFGTAELQEWNDPTVMTSADDD